ncbi:MAG: S9 family peptidase, partial [Propionibacteriaceae bacterium]|nr:S9 family peptidase [Propionibacteriaceae bacterium]
NYSGSTSLGRAYRERLYGAWGLVDVRDCIDAAHHLIDAGLVDPNRLAIMGGSAGGFTTLAALTTSKIFSAGISQYGVADLEALSRDTHKFESRYNDTLIAPYPAERHIHQERSPINHIDQLSAPMLLLQGGLDRVVPVDQAQAMFEAARAKGLDAELVIYEDEGHGWRQAPTIEDAYTKIINFLGRIWHFTPKATKD